METKESGFLNRTSFHVTVILLLGIALYLNSMNGPFTFDDKPNIVNSPVVKNFGFLWDAAQSKYNFPDPKLKPQFASRIVGYLSFYLNYRINGLAVFGYHLFNVSVHLINSLLAYLIAITLFTSLPRPENETSGDNQQSARILAFFSALLFVCHPIQTQAITYIVQRFTSLATLFYLASIAGYLKSRLSEHKPTAVAFYLGAFASAILAMKTKEFAFTLPVMLTMIDFMFIKSELRKRVGNLAAFYLLLSVIPLTLLTAAKNGGGAITASSFEFGSSATVSRGDYFLTQLTVIVKYLALLFPPVIQNLDYDYPLYHSFADPRVYCAAGLLVSLLLLGFYLLKLSKGTAWYANYARLVSFGIFWFFITIAPESSIIRIKDLVFEHRMYLPSVGLFIAITASVLMLKHHLSQRETPLERIIAPCAIFMIFLLSFATWARNKVWQDEVWLWQDTAAKSPNKPRPHDYLAHLYYDRGLYEPAMQENLISYRLKPDPGIHLNIGNILLRLKLYEQAGKAFEAAKAAKHDQERAYYGSCIALYHQKRYADAIQACGTALELKPGFGEARNMLGVIALEQGDPEGALKNFQAVIASQPDFAMAHNGAGNAYLKMKRYDAALSEYRTVSLLDGNFVGVHRSIGQVYHDLGRLEEAVRECKIALRQKPDFPEARKLLEDSQREIAARHL